MALKQAELDCATTALRPLDSSSESKRGLEPWSNLTSHPHHRQMLASSNASRRRLCQPMRRRCHLISLGLRRQKMLPRPPTFALPGADRRPVETQS